MKAKFDVLSVFCTADGRRIDDLKQCRAQVIDYKEKGDSFFTALCNLEPTASIMTEIGNAVDQSSKTERSIEQLNSTRGRLKEELQPHVEEFKFTVAKLLHEQVGVLSWECPELKPDEVTVKVAMQEVVNEFVSTFFQVSLSAYIEHFKSDFDSLMQALTDAMTGGEGCEFKWSDACRTCKFLLS